MRIVNKTYDLRETFGRAVWCRGRVTMSALRLRSATE